MTDLGPYAQPLFESLAEAVPPWAIACVRKFDVDPGDIGATAWVSIRVSLHEALDLSEAASGPNPMAVLRRAAAEPTRVLAAAGVVPVARDDFNVRRSPHDIYDLEPAAWQDFGDEVHELGIIWGAAKTHAHLRRRLRL